MQSDTMQLFLLNSITSFEQVFHNLLTSAKSILLGEKVRKEEKKEVKSYFTSYFFQ